MITLTRRRKEFLSKINKIYKQTGQSVHYITIAKALGVSKWTAYDVLRELEKKGLLSIEYAINREERTPGRSQVLFKPTLSARRFLEEDTENLAGEEWLALKERLLNTFDKIKSLGSKKIIEELLEEMRTVEKPITYSAYTITLLIAYLHNLGNLGIQMVERFLKLTPKPDLTLSMFTGTVLGTMIKNMKEAVNIKITSKISKFQRHVSEFNGSEKKLLVNFLGEALERVTS